MKRYSIFDLVDSWHSTLIFVGKVHDEKPMILVPKPIAWLYRCWRNIYIKYLEVRIWYKYRSPWRSR